MLSIRLLFIIYLQLYFISVLYGDKHSPKQVQSHRVRCQTDGQGSKVAIKTGTKMENRWSTARPKATTTNLCKYNSTKSGCRNSPKHVSPKFECGNITGSAQRVSNGREAYPGEYPWMAALGYKNSPQSTEIEYNCGGSLISSSWILTAAHCISKTLVQIRLGVVNLVPKVDDKIRPIDVNITECKVITHPSFKLSPFKTHSNDIALIRMKKAVNLTGLLRPICIPYGSQFKNSSCFENKRFYIAGWGETPDWRRDTGTTLMTATVKFINRQTCQVPYSKIGEVGDIQIKESMICAKGNHREGNDTCLGDSGGPLMYIENSKMHVVGVVAFGSIVCGDSRSSPGVYTNVAHFTDWIRKETKLRERGY